MTTQQDISGAAPTQDISGAAPTPQRSEGDDAGPDAASQPAPDHASYGAPQQGPLPSAPSGPYHQPQGYPPQGYPPQGYPLHGYPPQGYAPQDYAPQTQTQTSIADLFERSVKECLMKNFIIVVVSMLFFRELESCVKTIPQAGIGDFLLLISIILVTACFANFAFSYEHSIMELLGMRLLSHVSTFIFMLLIALLLESMVIGIALNYQGILVPVIVFCLLLYVGCALYDFWDLFRSFKGTVERNPMRPSGLL